MVPGMFANNEIRNINYSYGKRKDVRVELWLNGTEENRHLM